MDKFYLSIVAASRNDNHGDQLIDRMQAFINGVIKQSKRHHFPVELILVEWNPPENRPSLTQVLKIPKNKSSCEIRIITVPKKLHQLFNGSENSDFYQMIAKNIGIRRAKGKYVLATNIDILFSDQLFIYFKKKKLKPEVVYRTDRLDIPSDIPNVENFDVILNYCYRTFFRINGKTGTKYRKKSTCYNKNVSNIIKKSKNLFKKLLRKSSSKHIFNINRWRSLILFWHTKWHTKWHIKWYTKWHTKWHTNACGDFTLLSRQGWEALRGYPEWPIHSWHLDSLFLYQAQISQFRQKNFHSLKPIFHIEHSLGSGYSMEGAANHFQYLKEKDILYLDCATINYYIEQLKKTRKFSKTRLFNDKNWGLIQYDLKEECF